MRYTTPLMGLLALGLFIEASVSAWHAKRADAEIEHLKGMEQRAAPAESARDPGSTSPARPSMDDQKAHLQTSFSRQTPDPGWSRGAEARLSELLRPLAGDQTSVRSVDCRETLCRAELEHATEAGFRGFMTSMRDVGMHQWRGAYAGGRVRSDPRGPVTTVLFFAREGTELPFLP